MRKKIDLRKECAATLLPFLCMRSRPQKKAMRIGFANSMAARAYCPKGAIAGARRRIAPKGQ